MSMRISTTQIYNKNLRYLQNANSQLDSSTSRYNSGLKFSTAAEDPAGMASKIKYDAAIASYKQYATNAGLAADTMSEEETALDSMWTALSSANTRLIQAVDSTNDDSSNDAIAEDLIQIRDQLFDLMNTRNADGEYIFSGAKSSVPTMIKTSSGSYSCQADGQARKVQVAPSVKVQVSDSGLNIFENCQLAKTISTTGNDTGVYGMIANYGTYDSVFEKYYDPTGNTSNQLTLTIDADGKFTLADPSGKQIDSGEVASDSTIETSGLSFTIADGQDAGPRTITITMEKPGQDNILNQLTQFADDLRNGKLTTEELSDKMAYAQQTVQNAMDQYDKYRGRVGSRESEVENVINSDNALKTIKTTAEANITEVDAFEAASDIVKDQQALTTARSVYSKINGTSLFDYI
ncbi:MAG: flagellar hook-associated protein FlgL [Succinivibrio sp.]